MFAFYAVKKKKVNLYSSGNTVAVSSLRSLCLALVLKCLTESSEIRQMKMLTKTPAFCGCVLFFPM